MVEAGATGASGPTGARKPRGSGKGRAAAATTGAVEPEQTTPEQTTPTEVPVEPAAAPGAQPAGERVEEPAQPAPAPTRRKPRTPPPAGRGTATPKTARTSKAGKSTTRTPGERSGRRPAQVEPEPAEGSPVEPAPVEPAPVEPAQTRPASKSPAAAKAPRARATSGALAPPPARKRPTAPPPASKAPRTLPDEIGGYRILGALGRGGMGAVYRARDGEGRIVALKLLHAHLDDPDARERLTREVASLQKVRHAGVARVLDAEIESTEAFVVTELVAGRDLGKHVKRSGALPADQLVVLATRLREALEVVHRAGVLHRDLTPGNIMVTAQGPVLIDFGLAQAVEDARVTSTGLVTGTPGYVSPDLLDGDAPTQASDWWGWAAVLTFAATGRPPFGKGTIGTVLTRVRAGEPDLAGLPPALADALRGALAVSPADRTVPEELVAALEDVAAHAVDGAPAEADGADEAPDLGADDAGETVVVTAIGTPADVDDAAGEQATRVLPGTGAAGTDDELPDDGWAHDGGTTVMPTGAASPAEVDEWAEEDDAAYGTVLDADADEDGYDQDAYGEDGYDEDGYSEDAYDENGYGEDAYDDQLDDSRPAYVPPPLARRTGTVAALALPFLALGLARPGAAFVAALVVAALLRSVELDAEAVERRRARRGPRPSDRLRAVLTWPWYLVRGTLGVVPVLVVGGAVVVLVGGVSWWLIEAGHWTIAPLVPGQGSGLLRGNLPWVGRAWVGVMAAVGLAMVWFGPMARAHRDGARRVLAQAAPGGWGVLAAVVVGVAVAAVLAVAMLGQDVVWWPLGGHPRLG